MALLPPLFNPPGGRERQEDAASPAAAITTLPQEVRPCGPQQGPSAILEADEAAANEHLVVRLEDILPLIPTRCLKPGLHDPDMELRFHVDELSQSIARGKASVTIARLAELCPAVFNAGACVGEDVKIRLPFQKLIEQLGFVDFSKARPATSRNAAAGRGSVGVSQLFPVASPASAAPVPVAPEPPATVEEALVAPLDARQTDRTDPPVVVTHPPEAVAESIAAAEEIAPAPAAVESKAIPLPELFVEVNGCTSTDASAAAHPIPAPLPQPEQARGSVDAPDAKHVRMPHIRPPAPRPPIFKRDLSGLQPPGAEPSPVSPRPADAEAEAARPALPPPALFGRALEPQIPAQDTPGKPELSTELHDAVIPPLALPRFHQSKIQGVFLTDDQLDLPKIARLSTELPGVQGCLILAAEEIARAGDWPSEIDPATLRGICQNFAHSLSAHDGKLLSPKALTLHGERSSLTFFARPLVFMGVAHTTRGFMPGVLEKLAALADGLAQLPTAPQIPTVNK